MTERANMGDIVVQRAAKTVATHDRYDYLLHRDPRNVSNSTLDQLRDVLCTRLGRVYSGVRRARNATTRFDISVANEAVRLRVAIPHDA